MDLMRRRPTLPKIDENLSISVAESTQAEHEDDFMVQEVTSRGELDQTTSDVRAHIKTDNKHLHVLPQQEDSDRFSITRSPSPRTPNGRRSSKSFSFNNADTLSILQKPHGGCCIESCDQRSDLALLKAKANQLNLQTRRPSYVAWRQLVLSRGLPVASLENNAYLSCKKSVEGTATDISNSLDWIKQELEHMRTEDQNLARTFLKIRSDIHELKLKWSCEDHKVMLDDTQEDLEDIRMVQMICDRPVQSPGSEDLRKLGVTKMNITSRRFSTC